MKNIKTLERLAKTGNTGLIVKTARAHSSYSGFIEDKMEDAEIAGDMETAEEMRARAIDRYKRSEAYAFRALAKSNKTFNEARTVDLDVFEKALQKLKKRMLNRCFGRLMRWDVALAFRKMTQCR